MNSYIPLDRRFKSLSQTERIDPEALWNTYEDLSWDGSRNWSGLLKSPRVVILASAGAGKSVELQEQQRCLYRNRKAAFYVALEDLANEELERLLLPDELSRFNTWKQSDEQAWFFLDSVDELKLALGKITQAFRRLRRSVDDCLHRVNIIVSSRPTDWFPEDETTFVQLLPFVESSKTSIPSAEEVFLDAIQQRSQDRTSKRSMEVKSIETVILLPLSRSQVGKYADQRGISDKNSFLIEIDETDSWLFARRPSDLNDLIRAWKNDGRLGTRAEQHESNVSTNLKEGISRRDAGLLTDSQAYVGAQKIALALTLLRKSHIGLEEGAGEQAPDGISDVKDLLLDWTPQQRASLLRRAIFDPKTLGRVQFHHSSLREFLAARRLHELREKGMAIKSIFRLFFADKYGEEIVVPSFRPIAAWLSLWDTDVCNETINREPQTLLEFGDPGSLPISTREKLIRRFISLYGLGGWRGLRIPIEQIARIAHPELSDVVKDCWGQNGPKNPEARTFLLNMMWQGRMASCVPIARSEAISTSASVEGRSASVKLLFACGLQSELRKIVVQMAESPHRWPSDLIATLSRILFPESMSVAELVMFIGSADAKQSESFRWALQTIVENPATGFDRSELIRELVELLMGDVQAASHWHEIHSFYRRYCPIVALLCIEELNKGEMGNFESSHLRACIIAYHMSEAGSLASRSMDLRNELRSAKTPRQSIFWTELAIADQFLSSTDSWDRFWKVQHDSLIGNLVTEDLGWLFDALADRSHPERMEVAVHAIVWVWRRDGQGRKQRANLRKRLAKCPETLCLLFDKKTEIRAPSREELKMEREAKLAQEKFKIRERARIQNWKSWRENLLKNPSPFFEPQQINGTIQNIYGCLHGQDAGNSYCLWNADTLSGMFGESIAGKCRSAFAGAWRTVRPLLWSEKQEDARNSTSMSWIYGLCGVQAEAENDDWAVHLSEDEARLATRYATVEINRFAPFISDLTTHKPNAVDAVIGGEIDMELQVGGTQSHLPILQNLTHSDFKLKKLLTPRLLSFLEQITLKQENLNQPNWYHNLGQIFYILAETVTAIESKKLAALCGRMFRSKKADGLRLVWLRGLFSISPMDGVREFLWAYGPKGRLDRKGVASTVASIFGIGEGVGLNIGDHDKRAKALGKLVTCVFKAVKPEDDIEHYGTFTPGARDNAQHARDMLLSYLIETPGYVAKRALERLATTPEFKSIPDRLKYLAVARASKDSELEPWTAKDVTDLERTYDLPPATNDTLFRAMMDRLDDLQHFVWHGDFSDRTNLSRISQETEMQRILAQRLHGMTPKLFLVTREEEVVDSKEPDIRLHTLAGDVKAAIEIKIADARWSLNDFVRTIEKQLVGQYLRHKNCAVGCVLLTYNGKQRFWRNRADHQRLSFASVLEHLKTTALKIEKRQLYAVKIGIFGLYLTPPS